MVLALERKEVNEWRKFRLVAYMQSDGKKKIEEFLPLPGDPKKYRGAPVSSDDVKRRLKLMGSGSRNVKTTNNSG